MILSQGILDELRHQAELQGKKNYRCIEVDWRTVIALCDEVDKWNKNAPINESFISLDKSHDFIRGERVVFSAKEYGFLAYSCDGGSCFLNPLDSEDESHSFAVLACNVRKSPL